MRQVSIPHTASSLHVGQRSSAARVGGLRLRLQRARPRPSAGRLRVELVLVPPTTCESESCSAGAGVPLRESRGGIGRRRRIRSRRARWRALLSSRTWVHRQREKEQCALHGCEPSTWRGRYPPCPWRSSAPAAAGPRQPSCGLALSMPVAFLASRGAAQNVVSCHLLEWTRAKAAPAEFHAGLI